MTSATRFKTLHPQAHRWGQALVEFALVTPLLLLIILGGAQIGLLILADMRLTHAVMEGVVAGASEPDVPQRCDVAVATTEQILGHSPTTIHCTEPGNFITIRATEAVRLIVPLFGTTLDITAEESAAVRR